MIRIGLEVYGGLRGFEQAKKCLKVLESNYKQIKSSHGFLLVQMTPNISKTYYPQWTKSL